MTTDTIELTPEALKLIMTLPREEWADGFFVMRKCIKTYDPTQSQLKTYFGRAMKNHRKDELRRSTGASRKVVDGVVVRSFGHRITRMLTDDIPARSVPLIDLPRLDPSMTCLDLHVRGLSSQQISDLLGMKPKTVRVKIHNYRKILQGLAPRAKSLPSRGGIYRGSDSERTAMSQQKASQ